MVVVVFGVKGSLLNTMTTVVDGVVVVVASPSSVDADSVNLESSFHRRSC